MASLRRGLCFILLFFLIPLQACSPSRGFEAALLLADIAAGEGRSRLKESTLPPGRSEIEYKVGSRLYRGDLYNPGEAPLAGIVLVPGAAEEGKDDPRLVAFASSLARARFSVLVPDMPSLRALRVNAGNVREIADAFSSLAGREDLAPEGRVGIVAFSYAAGPAVLAAMEPHISGRVRFILAVGGYHDLVRVLTFSTTGYFWAEGKWRFLKPNAYGKWIFVLANLHRLSDPLDRRLFGAMAERKKRDLEANLDDLSPLLAQEGRRLFAFITNSDPQRVPELIESLPEEVRAEIDALNLLGRDFSRLGANLILVHGPDDNIIPYTESVALAGAVEEGRARLFLAGGLQHVDLQPGLSSRWRLWRAILALLEERDGEND